ncbi:MAG: two component transcriptional regulator, AraC family [Firmicutes bacterium]|nr:two component transcriptional regulator, AraC family [Bacillota bacterium]
MYNVLIVDDSDIVCRQLKRLKLWGGDLSGFVIAAEAHNGQAALERLRAEKFDLVITDIRMPKVNGVELLVKITEEKLAPCVVFLSEFSEFRYAKQGLVYGAFDYLVKPVKLEDVRDLLVRVRSRLLLVKREEQKLNHAIKSAVSWMPEDEISQMKMYLKSGSPKTIAVAEAIADRVEVFCTGDALKADILIKDILRDLVSEVLTEFYWMDKYVGLRLLVESFADRAEKFGSTKTAFASAVKELCAKVVQFSPPQEHGAIVRETTRYILENIDERISVRDIATALYINRTYMSEVFKEKMGITVGEYLTGIKMARAQGLLSDSGLRTVDVAERLGYSDANYFSHQFKQQVGMSIDEYRISQGRGHLK